VDDDLVFRALADRHRRTLLDRLHADGGQTLTQLCEAIPQMTRFGVMKHLAVLEEAHLVVTRRQGREKHHFVNPVPIREVHDRWISKFAEPWVEAMVDLKQSVEGEEISWQQHDSSPRPTSRPRRSASGTR
jgi:DNA-binding transcriptional ArsR family regulator